MTTSIRPGPSLMTASPNSGQVSSTTSATSLSTRGLPSAFFFAWMGILPSSFAPWIDEEARTVIRWFGVSMDPPVPITAPFENWSRPTSRASAVTAMASSSDTPWARIRFGSTWTSGILIRSPQIATFATPGTSNIRARIVQYAIIDRSVSGIESEDTPTFRNRPVVEIGGIITGGAAHVGSVGMIVAMRSCTSWRAVSSSDPGLKYISIEDRSGTDLERRMSRPAMPLSDCSIGTLT
jgi:hypothetical protein